MNMAIFDIERVGDREDDLVLEYDLALPGDNSIVAALRTNSSYLKMARYRLEADGGISLSGESQTLQAANVAITAPAVNSSRMRFQPMIQASSSPMVA